MEVVTRKWLRRLAAATLSLVLAACGSGVEGIPVPPPIDMAHLQRPETPDAALAAPDGFTPTPDIVTPIYDQTADELYAAVIKMAKRQARTYLLTRYDDRRQAHFVERIALLGFPDLITVASATGWRETVTARGLVSQHLRLLRFWGEPQASR